MTIAFPDVSNFQAGLTIQPGTVALCAKATEGTYYTDKSYADFKAQASKVGALFWAYHFLIQNNGAAQADYCFKVVGPSVPVMLDVEPIASQNSNPTVADCLAFIDHYKQLGGRVCLVYLPRWYWTQLKFPDLRPLGVPIVASGYPGSYSDSDANWSAYGGVSPAIWQYTDKQPYGGMAVDFNAFQGSVEQLAALISGDTMTPADVWAFQNTALDKIDMRQRLVNAENAATQALAAINALAARPAPSPPPAPGPATDLTALAAALAPLLAQAVVTYLGDTLHSAH